MAVPSTVIIVLLLAYLLVHFLLIAAYRLYRHPLKVFRGPWANSISELPSSWSLVRGRQHAYYYELHLKYGSVIRVAPNELIFTSADAWEDIYGFRKGQMMEKSPIFIGVVSPLNGCVGVGLAKGKDHSRQRRALAPGLSKTALYGQEEIIQRHISRLIAAMREIISEGKTANMADYFSFVTFDAISDLCFSEPFGCLAQGSATDWAKSIINVTIFATWDQAIRRVAGLDTWLRNLLLKVCMPVEASKWRTLHLQKSKEKTLQRLANKDCTSQDIIYHLLRNEDSKKSLSPTEIILNMVLFASAGSETTSITLTAWAYLICTHRDAHDLLVSEIKDTFKSSGEIHVDLVMGLPYLKATINEALRLFPPGAVAMQRVVPIGGATIDGHYVPAGTTVAVSPWVASRSSSNFKEPDCFRPERWIEAGVKEQSIFFKDRLYASRPFGFGPKRCLGEDLSYLESSLIIAHLLFTFHMELDMDGEHGEQNKLWTLDPYSPNIKLFQVLMKPKLWVRFTERQLC